MSNSTGNRYGPQLRMTLVYCSSEDDAFPARELACRTAHTSGWHSAKLCEYPQELGLRFEGEVDLQHLRLLVHESKIPSRIEVFIAEASPEDRASAGFPPYDAAVFRRLGHVNFTSNEENNYAARELKTVNVRKQAIYLKLIIRRNHSNTMNVFNQVSIVAISTHGVLLAPYRAPPRQPGEVQMLGEDEVPIERVFISRDISNNIGSRGGDAGTNNEGLDDTFGGTMDAATGRKVRELTLHKARAVAEEDYDLAKALKVQIEALREGGTRITLLEAEKQVAVDAEDYDRAKQIKKQIDEIREKAMSRAQLVAGGVGLSQRETEAARPPLKLLLQVQPQPEPLPPFLDPETPPKDQAKNAVNANNMPFDERPVGGGPSALPPFLADSPPAAAASFVTPPVMPIGPVTSHGNDEIPAVAGTGAGVQHAATGGLIVNKGAPKALQVGATAARVDQSGMASWERAVNLVAVSLAGEGTAHAEALPPGPKLAEFKDYITALGNYLTSCLFSKRWQLRECALRTFLKPEGFAALCGNNSNKGELNPNRSQVIPMLLLYLGANNYGLHDPLAQVFFAACDVFCAVVGGSEELQPFSLSQEGSSILPPPLTLAQLMTPLTPLLPALMLRAGDSNARIRDHAISALRRAAASGPPAVVEKIASAALTDPEGEDPKPHKQNDAKDQNANANANILTAKRRPMNHRVHLARITIITSLLETLPSQSQQRHGLGVDAIMTRVCLPCLQHSHQDVREAAQQLIVQLAKKSNIDKYLEDVKPAQKALIKEAIENQEERGPSPPVESHKPFGRNAEKDAAGGPAISESPKAMGPRRPREVEMTSNSVSVGKGTEDIISAAARAAVGEGKPGAKTMPKLSPADAAERKKRTCPFCRVFNPSFDEAALDQHFIDACPMLCPCPLCGQVLEIAVLQGHLVNDCSRRDLVKRCPRCMEAVRSEDINAHIAARECHEVDLKKVSLCPLCHALLPPGEKGWIQHLAKAPGCPNNPRSYDGSGVEL